MSAQKIIIPTLTEYGEKDFKFWAKELKPYFKSIHVDVIDESYDKPTWFDEIDSFQLLTDYQNIRVHLMVEDPVVYLENKRNLLKKEGVIYLIPKTKVDDYKDFLDLEKLGYNLGIVYEPADQPNPAPQLFTLVKEFMFMGIIPGATGRSMVIDVFEKMEKFVKDFKPEAFDIPISVDGGFNEETASKFLHSDAKIIYANSFFRNHGVKPAIDKLESFN
ncbi:hypothetical protein GW755_02875 [bacterium]|nr:hypothetical protein [Candidatus Parcubacteria bacterium]NCT55770.1 hypothetical protein [bacterium]